MRTHIWKKTAAGVMAVLLTAAYAPALPIAAVQEVTAADSAAAEDALAVQISDEHFPTGELTFGGSFVTKGIVTCDAVIAKGYGGIYTASGEQLIYKEFEPNAETWDFGRDFDAIIPFGKLAVGEYVYRVTVSDAEGRTAVAAESSFSVADNSVIGSEITVYGESIPADALPVNAVFSVRGQIASAMPLTRVWGGVYNADGSQTEVWYEESPNTSIYDLNAVFDANMDFSLLKPGSYVYRIEAEDTREHKQTLIEKEFRIVDDASAKSDIQLYNASYPTGTLMQGRGVSVKGRIYSTYAIESVTGGIYKAEGSESTYNNAYVFTVAGGKRSFNLNQLDNDILYNELPEGEYVYRVSATDVNGYTKELISSQFRIRSTAQDASKPQIVMRGMDISEMNAVYDWERVYADGMDFVILRAGMTYNSDANYHEDTDFAANFEAAGKAGLKVGVYLYTSAVTKNELKADIDGLLATLDGRTLDMPVYIDVETNRQSAIGKAALTDLVAYGCKLLSDAGCKAGVYSSYSWFRDYIDADVLCDTNCEIWLAFWPDDPSVHNLSDFCVTWQYCSDGTVDGITGDVDKDYRYAALSPERYDITLVNPEQGTLTADKTQAASGERVTVSAVLDRRHRLKSVKCNGMEASRNADGTFSFSMPDEAAEITAELEDCDPAETATDFGSVGSSMPVPFGTAGDSAPYHAKPCNERLATLPEALMKLIPDGEAWSGAYGKGKPAWALTLMDYANIYSFIHSNDLDPAVLRSVLSDGSKMIHRKPFTDAEIDLLLGDDQAAAMAAFASQSTIVIGEKGYSAKWMYCHTAEDYKAEGITPEMVAAVQPYYYNPLYVQEAADAFAQKLFQYSGKLTQVKWDQWNKGDVDLNGTVDAQDTALLRSYLNYNIRLGFSQWASADMNCDSVVDASDLIELETRLQSGSEEHSVMLDVMEYCQYPDYPTGCESVSLFMLLKYYGVDVTVDQIYDLLPMGPQPYDDENGVRHGANPEREFVGDPRSAASYGVFNDPIAGVAEHFKPGVRTERSASIDRIKEILDSGHPVLAWYVSSPMRDIMYRRSWLDENNELVNWPGGEHAVVICGYTDHSLVYRDPNAGTTVIIDYDTFTRSYTELGGRIVYYTNEPQEQQPTETIPTETTPAETTPSEAVPTETTPTDTTPSETATESRFYAPIDELCGMAEKDYALKNGTDAAASASEMNADGTVSIILSDAGGNVLDTYTIDPVTAVGTNSSGGTVSLPQTGNSSPTDLLTLIGAFLTTLLGGIAAGHSAVARKRSAFRKED